MPSDDKDDDGDNNIAVTIVVPEEKNDNSLEKDCPGSDKDGTADNQV